MVTLFNRLDLKYKKNSKYSNQAKNNNNKTQF